MSTQLVFWRCPECHGRGEVQFRADATAAEREAAIRTQHSIRQPSCYGTPAEDR